jgi:hypothetical protein
VTLLRLLPPALAWLALSSAPAIPLLLPLLLSR